jgi:hypothetical protein
MIHRLSLDASSLLEELCIFIATCVTGLCTWDGVLRSSHIGIEQLTLAIKRYGGIGTRYMSKGVLRKSRADGLCYFLESIVDFYSYNSWHTARQKVA